MAAPLEKKRMTNIKIPIFLKSNIELGILKIKVRVHSREPNSKRIKNYVSLDSRKIYMNCDSFGNKQLYLKKILKSNLYDVISSSNSQLPGSESQGMSRKKLTPESVTVMFYF